MTVTKIASHLNSRRDLFSLTAGALCAGVAPVGHAYADVRPEAYSS